MDLLPDPFRTILAFVVVLGVLVFVHELGHYLAARWRGVHVEAFSIGFGRPLWSWTDRRGTNWRVGWIPLGGYVKLHGQEHPGEAPPEQRARYRRGETFHEKPVGDRAIVVAAGPLANFLLAAVLFAALFGTVGVPRTSTAVGGVVEGSAAERAGLRPGDRVLALDSTPVNRFEELQRYVQARPGVPIEIRVRRGEQELTLRAVPEPAGAAAAPGGARGGIGVLGIRGGAVVYERLGPLEAIWTGAAHTAEITWQTLAGVWQMIAGERGTEELGGPLRIAQLSGQVAEMGWASLVSFIAVLSVNLALINLFPIPLLDGGHLLFYAAEALRGRPLPPRAQEIGLRAGFALLITLFLFATWNDLAQWGVFRWIAGIAG
ncbi:RIP metalloprotease RseP [Caldovatus aquaticus]|uniref:Zinc metalloprotease n=1 Tax=Caldovatus aquaticus TaxID=2865671 RepID=A0ABS7F1D4_9PROT|nr:RIP metalloprotease RseP [Caldovatus aquaticus]MBW8269318.1 RIP metalloprotease RseP [Caldovatus aquaticus]